MRTDRVDQAREGEPAALPMVPAAVMVHVHAYGDARADNDPSHTHLMAAIMEMRRWAGSLLAASATPPTEPVAEPAEEMPCGHHSSLLLRSTETGEPLYCELCDAQSGRRDAEQRETELAAANAVLRARIAALEAAAVPLSDETVDAAAESAYWQFDARRKGYAEWKGAPQSERDAFKAEARALARGVFPTKVDGT